MPEMIEKYWAGQCLALDIADLEFEKAFTAYEYTRDINAKRAELKVMVEGGTEDDLLALYSEAAAETNEQKKGIFATFIEKIVNVFRSIGQKISSLFAKKDIPADKKGTPVEVPDNSDFKQASGKFKGLVSNFVNAVKNNSLTEQVVDAMESEVAKMIGSAAVGFAAKTVGSHVVTKVKGKWRKKKAEDVKKDAEDVAKDGNALSEILAKMKDAVAGSDEQSGLIKRGLSAISAGARAMGDAAKGMVSNVMKAVFGKGKDDEKSEGSKEDNSEKKSNEPIVDSGDGSDADDYGPSKDTIGNEKVQKDTIDVSTDEGMLAFEKMLDALVADDDDIAAPVTESTEDVPPETEPAAATEEPQEADPEEVPAEEGASDESGSDDGEITEESAMSDEESSALDDALAEFNSLFN